MPSDSEIASIQVLGVSLVGPPPIGEVHIQLTPGLTALYGLNGAGKTVVLSALERAFHGYAHPDGEAYLHIEIPPVFTEAADRMRAATRHVRELNDWLDLGVSERLVRWHGGEMDEIDDLAWVVAEERDWHARERLARRRSSPSLRQRQP